MCLAIMLADLYIYCFMCFSVITGSIKRNVISAKTRIDLLVDTARQRHQFTHFLSIPLNGEIIQKKFQEFRSAVLASCAEVVFKIMNF